jgi:hypothetical protein
MVIWALATNEKPEAQISGRKDPIFLITDFCTGLWELYAASLGKFWIQCQGILKFWFLTPHIIYRIMGKHPPTLQYML